MITILLKPNGGPSDSWPPVQVHGNRSTVARLIAQGWAMPTLGNEPGDSPTAHNPDTDTDTRLVNLNTASVRKMTTLKGVGIAKANAIVQSRPIQDLAELIEKIDGVEWLDIESQITF